MMNIKKYAIIVAGGKGTRMGAVVPKQFLPLNGKPLLCYPIEAFAQAIPDIHLILVIPPDQLRSAQTVLRSYLGGVNVTIVSGGETRYHSVQNGLKEVKDDGVIFVHDGARPLVSGELILRCFLQAVEKGSAIPAVPVTESIRVVDDGNSRPLNREHIRIIQTPQTFNTRIILPAFRQEYQASFTDEATVVEAYGEKVHLIEGARDNVKVTTLEDMLIAEVLLKARNYVQIA
ncbi:MAG: 2-C-methyl-D-erythritol 4-phosphate cytidylyltransferase [Legionellales bacterium]